MVDEISGDDFASLLMARRTGFSRDVLRMLRARQFRHGVYKLLLEMGGDARFTDKVRGLHHTSPQTVSGRPWAWLLPPPLLLPLDTRILINIPMNVIVPKLEYAGKVWEGNAKLVKKLETVQTTAAKKILGCPSTTTNPVFGVELGMYPLNKTNRNVRKLKWQYKARNMPEKRLPAIADRVV